MIEIITGYQINSASPIDSRIVPKGLTARNDIIYKYNGLRVFDVLERCPYVWVQEDGESGEWISENSFSVGISGSSANYIPIFKNNTSIGNSILYQKYSNIGLNTTNPTDMFEVKGGNISIIDGYFKGDGSGLKKLNATEITNGVLKLKNLVNGPTGHVLYGGISEPKYVDPIQISVGTSSFSSYTDKIKLISSPESSSNFIPFSSAITGQSELKCDNNLKYDSISKTLNVGSIKLYNNNSGLTASVHKSTQGSFYKSTSVPLGGTFSVGYIKIDNNVAFSLNATFVTSTKPLTVPPSSTQSYHTNTIYEFYMVDNIGVITLLSKDTIFSSGWTYSSTEANDGYIITSSNEINFIADVNGVGLSNCTVYYNIVVL